MDELTPRHETGIQTNTESSRDCSNEAATVRLYQTVSRRLLDVNGWDKLAGFASATFRLTDAKGHEVDRPAKKGDHFKINIPGPGPDTGQGYDWVRIEAVEQDDMQTAIRVRPATNPLTDDPDIAHFFSDSATSSFIVRRENCRVTAGVYGRNEKPNVDTHNLHDKIRNTAVATGAAGGLAKLQWKNLVNGLVQD